MSWIITVLIILPSLFFVSVSQDDCFKNSHAFINLENNVSKSHGFYPYDDKSFRLQSWSASLGLIDGTVGMFCYEASNRQRDTLMTLMLRTVRILPSQCSSLPNNSLKDDDNQLFIQIRASRDEIICFVTRRQFYSRNWRERSQRPGEHSADACKKSGIILRMVYLY